MLFRSADRLRQGARTLESFVDDRAELGYDPMDTLLAMNRVFRTGMLRDPDDWEQIESETVPLSVTAAES